MFSALDISTSALVAQRVRLNAISSNLANVSTTRSETGEIATVPVSIRRIQDRRYRSIARRRRRRAGEFRGNRRQ